MKIEHTQRGFPHVDFEDSYGSKCSLQLSSNIDPHIWLGVDVPFTNAAGHTRMHLTPEMVRDLLPHLQRFAETEGDIG